MSSVKYEIRRARLDDARGIHNAHMKSIQELCLNDYSDEQINVWGRKVFDKDKREKGINCDIIYVVTCNENIEGFAQLTFDKDSKHIELIGMYVTSKVLGVGAGKSLLDKIKEEALKLDGISIRCCSTITAQSFYEREGFVVVDDKFSCSVGIVTIPSITMSYPLVTKENIIMALDTRPLNISSDLELNIVSMFLYYGFGENYPDSSPDKYRNLLLNRTEGLIPETFVTCLNGILVATSALYEKWQDIDLGPWFGSLYVSPEYRNRGIARFSFENVAKFLRLKEYSKIYLHTSNQEDLYRSWGWSTIDHLTGSTEKIMEYDLDE